MVTRSEWWLTIAAASLHHNVLEEIAALEKERWTQWRRKQREEREKANGQESNEQAERCLRHWQSKTASHTA